MSATAPRKPGLLERQVIKKVVGIVPTAYLQAIRNAAEDTLNRRGREEGK